MLVCSFNVCMSMCSMDMFKRQEKINKFIDRRRDIDVFCLQESNWFCLKNKEKYYVASGYSVTKPLSSGLMTISRHPFTFVNFVPFDSHSYNYEIFMEKGILHSYSKGCHILNIHLQAWDKGSKIRRLQLIQIYNYIKKICTQQNIIVCGDWNINLHTQKCELSVLKDMIIQHAEPTLFSVDPESNPLVGGDDFQEYINVLYPNGCVSDNSGYCVCCQRELLDFFVWSKSCTLDYTKSSTIDPCVSDHYPIESKFDFDAKLWKSIHRHHLTTKVPHVCMNLWVTVVLFYILKHYTVLALPLMFIWKLMVHLAF